MKAWVLMSVGVMIMMMVSPPDSCHAQGTEALITLIINKLAGLWDHDEVIFMGHKCSFSHSPSFYRWELYYKGRMWCPGWAPFSGNSKTRSRAGSIEHATRDFVKKALENNLITEEEASAWLSN